MKRILALCIAALMMAGLQPDCRAQETGQADSTLFQLLMPADSMPVNNGQFVVLPRWGLFVADGATFWSLDAERCPEIKKLRLADRFPFEQVVACDGKLLVKSQQFVMRIGDERTEIAAELDTEDFLIAPGYDGKFNILVSEDDSLSAWYEYDMETATATCVMRTPLTIRNVCTFGQTSYCTVGSRLCEVEADECKELLESQSPILDVVVTPVGLMLCTLEQLFLYRDDEVILLADGPFFALYNDGPVVYAVMQNGDIYKCNL